MCRRTMYPYTDGCRMDEHILAQVMIHNMVCLISMSDGNRWTEPVHVENSHCISAKEWSEICHGNEFTKVG